MAANRDEFYERPTERAHPWSNIDGLIAGKDLRAGGTWMGVHASGHYGMVTNYRDPATEEPRSSSRGSIVRDYLAEQEKPSTYLSRLHQDAGEYNGYNTLLGDTDALWYYSNKSGEIKEVQPGIYGLSNHLLNTPWPKVLRGKALLETVIDKPVLDVESLFHILQDSHKPSDQELPQTGVPLEWERALSPMFIRVDGYGTRCSSVLTIKHSGEINFYERTYPSDGSASSTVHHIL